jgi:hypothetical protein
MTKCEYSLSSTKFPSRYMFDVSENTVSSITPSSTRDFNMEEPKLNPTIH